MVAMGPTHRGVGSHGALRDLQCSHRPGATFKGDDGARFVAGIERTTARAANRPSPSKMATLSPNSDAMVSATASILPVRDQSLT